MQRRGRGSALVEVPLGAELCSEADSYSNPASLMEELCGLEQATEQTVCASPLSSVK